MSLDTIPTVRNAILIFEKDGQVLHRFCPEAEANAHLDEVAGTGRVASMLAGSGMPADLTYSVSPNLRDHVDEVKRSLRFQIAIRDALDRQDVPADIDLRMKIFRAIKDLRETALKPFIPV